MLIFLYIVNLQQFSPCTFDEKTTLILISGLCATPNSSLLGNMFFILSSLFGNWFSSCMFYVHFRPDMCIAIFTCKNVPFKSYIGRFVSKSLLLIPL